MTSTATSVASAIINDQQQQSQEQRQAGQQSTYLIDGNGSIVVTPAFPGCVTSAAAAAASTFPLLHSRSETMLSTNDVSPDELRKRMLALQQLYEREQANLLVKYQQSQAQLAIQHYRFSQQLMSEFVLQEQQENILAAVAAAAAAAAVPVTTESQQLGQPLAKASSSALNFSDNSVNHRKRAESFGNDITVNSCMSDSKAHKLGLGPSMTPHALMRTNSQTGGGSTGTVSMETKERLKSMIYSKRRSNAMQRAAAAAVSSSGNTVSNSSHSNSRTSEDPFICGTKETGHLPQSAIWKDVNNHVKFVERKYSSPDDTNSSDNHPYHVGNVAGGKCQHRGVIKNYNGVIPGNLIDDFELRKASSEPNLKMKSVMALRTKLLANRNSPLSATGAVNSNNSTGNGGCWNNLSNVSGGGNYHHHALRRLHSASSHYSNYQPAHPLKFTTTPSLSSLQNAAAQGLSMPTVGRHQNATSAVLPCESELSLDMSPPHLLPQQPTEPPAQSSLPSSSILSSMAQLSPAALSQLSALRSNLLSAAYGGALSRELLASVSLPNLSADAAAASTLNYLALNEPNLLNESLASTLGAGGGTSGSDLSAALAAQVAAASLHSPLFGSSVSVPVLPNLAAHLQLPVQNPTTVAAAGLLSLASSTQSQPFLLSGGGNQIPSLINTGCMDHVQLLPWSAIVESAMNCAPTLDTTNLNNNKDMIAASVQPSSNSTLTTTLAPTTLQPSVAASVAQLSPNSNSSLLKHQLTELLLRRKSLVREEPEEEVDMEVDQKGNASAAQRSTVVVAKTLSNPEAMTFSSPSKTGLAYDSLMCKHQCLCKENKNHLEHSGRIQSIWARLQETGLVARCERLLVKKATLDMLKLVHSDAFTTLFANSPLGRIKPELLSQLPIKTFVRLPCGGIGVDLDTYYSEAHTGTTCRLAVGAVCDLTVAVGEGRLRNGMAIVRPPGHHAETQQPMGFCYFNNVAIAVKCLQQKLCAQYKRIVILDWDVHHGNGTQLAFLKDPGVLYISLHRHDDGNFFPGTGAVNEVGQGTGEGFTMNVAWSGDSMGDAEYLAAWRTVILPIFKHYQPQMIVVSAGFDATAGHPANLGGYRVTSALFGYFTQQLMKFADGRLVLALEGGYDLASICDCAEECVRVLSGGQPQSFQPDTLNAHPNQAAIDCLKTVVQTHRRYWPILSESLIEMSQVEWENLDRKFACLSMSRNMSESESSPDMGDCETADDK